jgi:transcription-repair coupling factor (superfamily II helicase)
VRTVLQPVSQGLGNLAPVALKAGHNAPLEEVVEDLAAAACTGTNLVERHGEFAVRGAILGAFPPTEDHLLWAEFWRDTVNESHCFKVAGGIGVMESLATALLDGMDTAVGAMPDCSIERAARPIRNLVSEARVSTAQGKMGDTC